MCLQARGEECFFFMIGIHISRERIVAVESKGGYRFGLRSGCPKFFCILVEELIDKSA